jgi:hypothetical protein
MLETSSHNSLNSHLFWSLIFGWFSGRLFWAKASSSAWSVAQPRKLPFSVPLLQTSVLPTLRCSLGRDRFNKVEVCDET